MANRASRKDVDKLLDDKERLLKEYPDLKHSYDEFRKDFENYRKLVKSQKGRQEASDYVIFGASFVKE